MSQGKWHVIERGQSAESLGAIVAVSVETVWHAAENADLRSTRDDPHLLAPGDRIFIPFMTKSLSLATNARHTIVIKRLFSRVEVHVYADTAPCSGEPYVLTFGATVKQGTTDGSGTVASEVPADVGPLTLKVGSGTKERTYTLAPRAIGPLTTPDGWRARLHNLGYDTGAAGARDPRALAALAAFQADHQLAESAEMDADTKAKLKEIHGC